MRFWGLEGKLLGSTTDGASNIKKCVTLSNVNLAKDREASWIHCAAHTIQLCINYTFRECKEAAALFKKCEGIVKFFNGCGAARQALKNERERVGKTSYKLITPTETRWNSRLTMGGRVHQLAGEMAAAVETVIRNSTPADMTKAIGMRSKLLKEQELLELKEICDLLQPAGDFTHLVGGSSYPTISTVYPKAHMLALFPALHTTEPAKAMHKSLTKHVKARFFIDNIPNATLIAMYLNPGCYQYKFFGAESVHLTQAKALAQDALRLLVEEVGDDLVALASDGKKNDEMEELFGDSKEDKARNELKVYNALAIKNPEMTAKYLDRPEDFWKSAEGRLPLLAALARAYLSIQATSSESERLFSKAGLLLPPKKVNIAIHNFVNLLMLNSFERHDNPPKSKPKPLSKT